MDEPSLGGSLPPGRGQEDRLDSWKEIALYLERDVTTVQRWERREGLPIHRHQHDRLATVYAFKSELSAWSRSRRPSLAEGTAGGPGDEGGLAPAGEPGSATAAHPRGIETTVAGATRWRRPVAGLATGAVLLLVVAGVWWVTFERRTRPGEPFTEAAFRRLTDTDGIEQAAAISRDGRFVAFLSDRDGRVDVWVSQVGGSQFYNLTRGRFHDLVNPSIRSLGFSPDGALVTFWARGVPGSETGSNISVWAVPPLGGEPRLYLEGAAEFDWAPDGSRVVYHTAEPGDPMFVAASLQEPRGQPIYQAKPGLHAHFPTWSPDGAFVYIVQGSPPDAMDIWRVRSNGGPAERISWHDALVSHPVFLTDRVLAYLATDANGSGPWLYTLDVEDRQPRRASRGLDRYTSLAASADGRHLVATLADPKVSLWRMAAGAPVATPISVPTGRGSLPRLGPDYLLYVAPQEEGDTLWKVAGDAASEIWSERGARIVGGPEISPDGRRVVMSVGGDATTRLVAMNADGTNRQVITASLELRGTPTWAADGNSITSAVQVDGEPRIVRISPDGSFSALVDEYSMDPAWAPGGGIFIYKGPDIGTTFKVAARTAEGAPHASANLVFTRGTRRLRLLGDGRTLVALLGNTARKDVWQIDLQTGGRRQVTHLPGDFEVRDFDVSPDGREMVVERVQGQADIVLIDLPGRDR